LYTYGDLGGADKTKSLYPGNPQFEAVLSSLSGVWYSHYAGMGRLDGYRIGKWEDFTALVEDSGKADLFPYLEKKTYTTQSGSDTPVSGDYGDYFVLYDDTVFGEGAGPPGRGLKDASYCGIVRAVNVFNGDPGRGALIIEYLSGCAPRWDDDLKDGRLPFFGMYYRKLSGASVQMANAVDLAALYNGQKYYTEKETLQEAVNANTVENEAEFISWGVVIPQDREP
jgi:hypothetical protein